MKTIRPLLLMITCLVPAQVWPAIDFNEAPAIGIATRPYDVAVGDLDHDGVPDLAIADGGLLLLRGKGDGNFTQTRLLSGAGAVRLVLADLDQDGSTDVACAGETALWVLRNAGDGLFAPPDFYPVDRDTWWIATGDFDGDGALDLVTSSTFTEQVIVLLNDGSGGFSNRFKLDVLHRSWSVVTGDFNSDGYADLVTLAFGVNTMTFILSDGRGGFSAPTVRAFGGRGHSPAGGGGYRDGRFYSRQRQRRTGIVPSPISGGVGLFGIWRVDFAGPKRGARPRGTTFCHRYRCGWYTRPGIFNFGQRRGDMLGQGGWDI